MLCFQPFAPACTLTRGPALGCGFLNLPISTSHYNSTSPVKEWGMWRFDEVFLVQPFWLWDILAWGKNQIIKLSGKKFWVMCMTERSTHVSFSLLVALWQNYQINMCIIHTSNPAPFPISTLLLTPNLPLFPTTIPVLRVTEKIRTEKIKQQFIIT